MPENLEIYQGDHGGPVFIRPEVIGEGVEIDNNWQCKTAVLDAARDVAITAKTITEKSGDNLHFFVPLSPDDSQALTVTRNPTQYYWVIELSNEVMVPKYKKEIHIPLFVRKQGIA